MDAVMFETKSTHLALQRVGRKLLEEYGITPARFDLMNALGLKGMRQSDLWKRLNVVRSVISVMVRALVKRGWVERARATDARTWLVTLTEKGREIFQRAFDERVENGDTAVMMDYGLTQGEIESDSQTEREHYLAKAMRVSYTFRTRPYFRGAAALYCADIEDYCYWLILPGDPAGEVPYAS